MFFFINAGTVHAKGHKWLSLRLARNPSERFQTSLPASGSAKGDQGRNDNLK
jgi:hypothetical protein